MKSIKQRFSLEQTSHKDSQSSYKVNRIGFVKQHEYTTEEHLGGGAVVEIARDYFLAGTRSKPS